MNSFNALLHAEEGHAGHAGLFGFLTEHLGEWGRFLDEAVFHTLTETLILVPFLFLTYLLMEFIEHKAGDRTNKLMRSAGALGPLLGGALGALPQCGFSAAAANLYTGRVITLGTIVAVFLSTSDEMIPILVAGRVNIWTVLLIIVYKIIVAIVIGFAVDLVLRLIRRGAPEVAIEDMCEAGGCHCERGIFRSALHHTLSVSLWCLAIIFALNTLMFFVPADVLGKIIVDIPVLGHFICALLGLIPNCAVSVALSTLAVDGVISTGEMLSGLFSGAGIGLFVLFKMNKRIRENLIIILIIVLAGTAFGALAELIPFLSF